MAGFYLVPPHGHQLPTVQHDVEPVGPLIRVVHALLVNVGLYRASAALIAATDDDLENLLGNAYKYIGKKEEARIEFGLTEDDGKRTCFVRDDGSGFDMAYADRLFGAFQRLHDASEFEGSGIGLATVQRIINRHGGQIWAESAPDQGATFFFTLH